MTRSELLRLSNQDIQDRLQPKRCMECKSPLSWQFKGLCEDCYYKKAGEIFEAHPIWHPRTRRGS